MSFRIEEKSVIDKIELVNFRRFMNTYGKILYPKRTIESLYFDNRSFDSYFDSEEGVLPRKKIRIRNYPYSNSNELFLENKTSSIEGRYKTSVRIDDLKYTKYKSHLMDDYYGLVFPKSFITYEREYFIINNFRVTLDTNIRYKSFNGSSIYNDHNIVIEIKAPVDIDLNFLQNLIQYPRSRFSKYSNSITFLNLV